jgi:signal peptidase II
MRTTSGEGIIERPSAANGRRTRWGVFLGVAAFVLLLDQISKYMVLTNLDLGEMWNPVPFLRPFVTVTHVTNTGAAFGLFQGHSLFFSIVAVVVVVGIIAFYRYIPVDEALLRICLGLQLGGALGNLLDRVRLGTVVDFIDFKIWPVFNLADTAIFTGVSILALYLLFSKEEERSAAGVD